MSNAPEDELSTGYELQSKGDWSGALAFFEKALNKSRTDARIWIAKGICLLKLKHWESAVQSLQEGIRLQPAYAEADARLLLADALLNSGRKKEAREQYLIVSKMEPCFPSYESPIQDAKEALEKLGPK